MFDNTFSILRPKKLRYYIIVNPPAPGSPTTSEVRMRETFANDHAV